MSKFDHSEQLLTTVIGRMTCGVPVNTRAMADLLSPVFA
jgi:hypothetical protein